MTSFKGGMATTVEVSLSDGSTTKIEGVAESVEVEQEPLYSGPFGPVSIARTSIRVKMNGAVTGVTVKLPRAEEEPSYSFTDLGVTGLVRVEGVRPLARGQYTFFTWKNHPTGPKAFYAFHPEDFPLKLGSRVQCMATRKSDGFCKLLDQSHPLVKTVRSKKFVPSGPVITVNCVADTGLLRRALSDMIPKVQRSIYQGMVRAMRAQEYRTDGTVGEVRLDGRKIGTVIDMEVKVPTIEKVIMLDGRLLSHWFSGSATLKSEGLRLLTEVWASEKGTGYQTVRMRVAEAIRELTLSGKLTRNEARRVMGLPELETTARWVSEVPHEYGTSLPNCRCMMAPMRVGKTAALEGGINAAYSHRDERELWHACYDLLASVIYKRAREGMSGAAFEAMTAPYKPLHVYPTIRGKIMSMTTHCTIVGAPYHKGAVENLQRMDKVLLSGRCSPDTVFGLQLRREPSNPHDPNAVAVWTRFRRDRETVDLMLGYIPRQDARAIARVMDNGVQIHATYKGKNVAELWWPAATKDAVDEAYRRAMEEGEGL